MCRTVPAQVGPPSHPIAQSSSLTIHYPHSTRTPPRPTLDPLAHPLGQVDGRPVAASLDGDPRDLLAHSLARHGLSGLAAGIQAAGAYIAHSF